MSTENREDDRRTDPVTRSYHEKSFRGSLLDELDEPTLTWLASTEKSWDDVVALERVRRENADVFATLMAAVDNRVYRRIIGCIALQDAATYRDLQDALPDVSRRTVKNHVWELQDAGVLDVGNGSPASIRFSDGGVDLLARDALSFHPDWSG